MNLGTGDGAFDADEASFARAALLELRALLTSAPVTFNRKHFPNEPAYLLYQNQLMASGMSPTARKELAMGRYAHGKKAKVGDTIACPGCGAQMAKKSYQHLFCQNKVRGRSNCKDFINNWFDPNRLMRALEALSARDGAGTL